MEQARVDDMERLNHWIGSSIKRGAIAILTHKNGDMDTVGSACALANIIGKNARPCGIHMSTIAKSIVSKSKSDFLILDTDSPTWPRDLGGLIIVDAAGPSQLGISIPDVPKCVIDHHSAGGSFDIGESDLEINWGTCSTAEIIYSWAEKYAEHRISTETRMLLLAGIITDTGRFRHANSHALGVASRISEDPKIDFSSFIEEMESIELNHSQRVAITKALSRVQTLDAGKWFLSHTRASTNEGIVGRSLIAAGADIALVCRRLPGETRLTARASRSATVGGIHLGEMMRKMVERSGGEGGGHAGAAGWTGSIDDVDATSGFISILMGNQGD
ncbi:MAG: DHH family phosphoesterase [Candidatus Thermoplasmatota archaeon]|nr:DHH family phosphoesterase [Candidatus Thermoplasmatota archaeon]